MFIRASTQKDSKTRKPYTTYRLVDGYRNAQGKVRQQTLLNLGCHFSVPKKHWKLLSDRVEELLACQGSLLSLDAALEKQAQSIAKQVKHKYAEIEATRSKEKNEPLPSNDMHTVDINSLEHHDIRFIGTEYLGHHAATQLELITLFKQLGFNLKQCHLALGSIIGRLVHPGSELSTYMYLKEQSALDELLGTTFSDLSRKNFYKIADKLLAHKEVIEKTLYQREKNLFNLPQLITLYDITNTYFEGRALKNSKAQHGRSKEKRSDCPLVSMGLVLDHAGFPQKSQIFPGNVSEPKTMEAMLNALDAKSDATIVMDAGFATEKNIDWLKEHHYHYVVVSRQAIPALPDDIAEVTVKDDPNNSIKAKLVKKGEDELTLYCHSQAKEEKSNAMNTKAQVRFEEELTKLAAGLKKKTGTKDFNKLHERLGRLKERHKRIAHHYTIEITPDESHDKATDITWKKNDEVSNPGLYCLRTNHINLTESEIWRLYTTLTEVEAAFRSLKTELGFRPVYHQKETRVDAHLFISLLAYHLLHTIRYQLKQQDMTKSWESIRQICQTQVRISTTIMTDHGKKLSVRKSAKATPEQLEIYKALGISSVPGKTEKVIF